ncbi:MAG: hypothetical protein ACI8V2_004718 [Candidatus Latescibacterota bacterium]|jgi:hypothetical protein
MADPNIKLISISLVNSPALLTIAKSILEDADIPYITRGEGFQSIYATGPVTLLVAEQDADQARELLADL